MPANRRALDFIERCQWMTSVADIEAALYAEVAAFGYAFVACGSHVDPVRTPATAVFMSNYPDAWLSHYSAAGYARIDAVYARATRTGLPFDWSDLLVRPEISVVQRRIFEEARAFGIAGGTTVPLATPNGVPASCSLILGDNAVDPSTRPALQLVALYAYETALKLLLGERRMKAPRLAKRERECLVLVGSGKSDNVTGELLGISGRTVHNLVERAKTRYGVASRIQLIVKALSDGHIDYADLDV